MRWLDLLFAHWAVDPAIIRPLIPSGLELDLWGGLAYIGIVPFHMDHVTARFVPPLPGLHAFPELNTRTYVTAGRKPGVWFFSLDAGQKLAVRTARRFFHLPYFDARFEIHISMNNEVAYAVERTHRGASPSRLRMAYRPAGPVYYASLGSLDRWLTARYCLYSADSAGRIYRLEIDHAPWPLQPAQAEIKENTCGDWLGIDLSGPPLLHFAKSLDVRAWFLERL